MGYTLTLDVPEDVYQARIQQAEQTGQPPEAVAVQLLATVTQHWADDPFEQFIAACHSHGADWANQHDAYLGNAAKDSMDPATSKGLPDVPSSPLRSNAARIYGKMRYYGPTARG